MSVKYVVRVDGKMDGKISEEFSSAEEAMAYLENAVNRAERVGFKTFRAPLFESDCLDSRVILGKTISIHKVTVH